MNEEPNWAVFHAALNLIDPRIVKVLWASVLLSMVHEIHTDRPIAERTYEAICIRIAGYPQCR